MLALPMKPMTAQLIWEQKIWGSSPLLADQGLP